MKKSIFNILIGAVIGILLMVGVISVLNMKPDNEDMMAQNHNSTETDSVDGWEDDFFMEDEFINDLTTEAETEFATEVEITESESEDKTQIADNKPVDAPYYIRVNRLANCVTVYAKDGNGNYTVPVKAMICSVGLTDETPLGVFSIYARYQWRPLFGGTYGQYAIRFKGSYLFHSVPYTQPSKDCLKEGQFNMLGEPASQGCVRLQAIDAKWLYDNCKNGTRVEVYESADPGPLGRPVAYKISENSPYRGWDPTDPDPANPWSQGTVNIVGVKDIVLNQGESQDLMQGISATDVDGLPLTVAVSGDVDWNTAGTYTVTYSATGVLGMTATATAVVTVNSTETPETEVPDTEVPETETPETETPETETPETETPETETPETETPETETPETETPETETPETETPETETPETETPGTETLDTQMPDTPEKESVEDTESLEGTELSQQVDDTKENTEETLIN